MFAALILSIKNIINTHFLRDASSAENATKTQKKNS